MEDFQTQLDALITRHKASTDLDTMIADMSGAIEGLRAELDNEEG